MKRGVSHIPKDNAHFWIFLYGLCVSFGCDEGTKKSSQGCAHIHHMHPKLSSSLQISEDRPIFLNQFIPNTQDFPFQLFHRKWWFSLQSNPPKYTVAAPTEGVGFSGKMVKKEKHVLGKLLYWHAGNMNFNVSQVPSTQSDLRSVSWTMLLIPGAKRRGSKEQQPYEQPKHEYLVDGSQNPRH